MFIIKAGSSETGQINEPRHGQRLGFSVPNEQLWNIIVEFNSKSVTPGKMQLAGSPDIRLLFQNFFSRH